MLSGGAETAQLDCEKIDCIEKNRNTVHDCVYATYSVFNAGGERYFQLDTYGRADRQKPGKVSQSLQLNEKTAKFLVGLLQREFHLS